jgi:phosphatidate cytidylyltransferase
MLSCIYLTRHLENGIYFVWLIFLSSWICDSCAYCVGMLWGRHKLAPNLSPKKSIEGALGGILGAMGAGALYGAFFVNRMVPELSVTLTFAVICGIGAVIAQIGDLAASAIKRNHEIKDFGKLIPGHGGIMDRFDSVIFTAPVIYALAVLV